MTGNIQLSERPKEAPQSDQPITLDEAGVKSDEEMSSVSATSQQDVGSEPAVTRDPHEEEQDEEEPNEEEPDEEEPDEEQQSKEPVLRMRDGTPWTQNRLKALYHPPLNRPDLSKVKDCSFDFMRANKAGTLFTATTKHRDLKQKILEKEQEIWEDTQDIYQGRKEENARRSEAGMTHADSAGKETDRRLEERMKGVKDRTDDYWRLKEVLEVLEQRDEEKDGGHDSPAKPRKEGDGELEKVEEGLQGGDGEHAAEARKLEAEASDAEEEDLEAHEGAVEDDGDVVMEG